MASRQIKNRRKLSKAIPFLELGHPRRHLSENLVSYSHLKFSTTYPCTDSHRPRMLETVMPGVLLPVSLCDSSSPNNSSLMLSDR